MIFQIIMVFILAVLNDMVWVYYIKDVNASKYIKAAVAGIAIYLFSSLVVISYIENKYMLIPAAIGSGVGTIVAIALKDKSDEK